MLTLDGSALLAWEGSTTLGVRPSGSCAFCCFGGEGCCYTTVTGPGTVRCAASRRVASRARRRPPPSAAAG
jgi:uncharacterized protein (AIM24 family)